MDPTDWQSYGALREYRIDGARFSTLEGFFDEVGQVLIPGARWGRNLDAFNDILRGGFGTPDEGFILIWQNAALSRERLGYAETERVLESRLARCHPTARRDVRRDLRLVRSHKGDTAFDWIVDIIRIHGPGGAEGEDNVILKLQPN